MCKDLVPPPPDTYTARVLSVGPGRAVVSATGLGSVTAVTRAVVFVGAYVTLVRTDGGWRVA